VIIIGTMYSQVGVTEISMEFFKARRLIDPSAWMPCSKLLELATRREQVEPPLSFLLKYSDDHVIREDWKGIIDWGIVRY
jgi:hypothetical protein